jgi:hypothetical protein
MGAAASAVSNDRPWSSLRAPARETSWINCIQHITPILFQVCLWGQCQTATRRQIRVYPSVEHPIPWSRWFLAAAQPRTLPQDSSGKILAISLAVHCTTSVHTMQSMMTHNLSKMLRTSYTDSFHQGGLSVTTCAPYKLYLYQCHPHTCYRRFCNIYSLKDLA